MEQVRDFRQDTHAVLTTLADGEGRFEQQIRQIDETQKKLDGLVAEDDPTSDVHRSRSTLAFGLHEVRQALSGLIEVTENRK